MLTDREARLLRLLANAGRSVPSRELAGWLGVSVRSVKTYVARLNQQYPGIVEATRCGYRSDRRRAAELLRDDDPAPVPQTRAERRSYVVQRLLGAKVPLNVYDLGEELYVSASTIKAEVPRIKEMFKRFGLSLDTEGDELSVRGAEKDKRRLVSSMLYEETSVNFVNLETVQRAFPDVDCAYVERCVREALESFRHFANDFSIVNIVLHIAITVDRIQSDHVVLDPAELPGDVGVGVAEEPLSALGSREVEMARFVARRLEERFGVTYTLAETRELALLLSSRTTLLDLQDASPELLRRFVGRECAELTDAIVADLRTSFGVDLTDREFYVRFALHLKNLLARAEGGGLSKNPLTRQIKRSCPLLYDAAVAESELIKRHTGLSIGEDEIAYIAFHLGSSLESRRRLSCRVNTVVYCPAYYDVNAQLVLFLETHFDEDLVITDVVTDEASLAGVRDVGLIVTTVPLNSFYDVPVFHIAPFPGEQDLTGLRRVVEGIRRDGRRAALRENLVRLIRPEFFSIRKEPLTREEAIHGMATEIIRLGYATSEFERQTFERERLSSTAFGSCAVPHPVRMCSQRSCISVMLSRTPIAWGDTSVSIVVMLSFSKSDQEIFYAVFEPLVTVLFDKAQVDTLMGAHDYLGFIDLLCGLIS